MYVKPIRNHSALLYLSSGNTTIQYIFGDSIMLIILPYSIPSYLVLSHASRPYLMLFFYPYSCSTLLHSTPTLLHSTLLYPLCSALHRKPLHRTLHDYTILRTRLHDGILPFDSTFPHRFVSVLVDVFVMYGLSVLVTHVNIN